MSRITRCLQLERAEVTVDIGPAKLIVEGSGADRPFDHDVQRGSNAIRLAERALPRLRESGNAQMRNGKARKTRLGFGAPPRRPFIPNLTARPGRGAWKRRDGGW